MVTCVSWSPQKVKMMFKGPALLTQLGFQQVFACQLADVMEGHSTAPTIYGRTGGSNNKSTTPIVMLLTPGGMTKLVSETGGGQIFGLAVVRLTAIIRELPVVLLITSLQSVA